MKISNTAFVFCFATLVCALGACTPAATDNPNACMPACRPGFACARGVCVSACNPLCAVGETCTPELRCVPSDAASVPDATLDVISSTDAPAPDGDRDVGDAAMPLDIRNADAAEDAVAPLDAAVGLDATGDAMPCTLGSAICPVGAAAREVCNSDGRSTRSEPCPTPTNASMARCGAANACTYTCIAGFGDCDGNVTNGCEAALAGDARNCGACGATCATGMVCGGGRCVTVPTMPVTPLANAREDFIAAVLLDGRVLVAGGVWSNLPQGSVEIYDPVLNEWRSGVRPPATTGSAGGARARDGRMFVFGGIEGTRILNSVYVLDAAATAWRTLAPMVERQAGNGPVLGSDDRIYFPGGYRNGVAVNFVQAYDPATDRWTEVAPTSQARGSSGVVTLRDGRIAVLGGYGMGGTILSNVELYDPSTNRWSAGASLPGALTSMGVVLASDDLVHVVGGYNGTSNVATHYAFDPVSGSVRILAPLPVGRSHFRLVEAPTGTLLAIGGRQTTTAGPTQVATVSAYSLAANAWR